MQLSIITPCTRPENLEQIHGSIFSFVPKNMKVNWLVVFDAETIPEGLSKLKNTTYYAKIKYDAGCMGNQQRNFGISKVKSGLVCFLDDDTLMHDQYLSRINSSLKDDSSQALVVAQAHKSGVTRLEAKPESAKVTHIDSSQFIIPRKMIGKTRWQDDNYCADGVFLETLHDKYPEQFVFLNEAVCWYNYLR